MGVVVDEAAVARDDKSAKLERQIVEWATRVAQHRRITVAEYLSGLVREQVRRDYVKALKEEFDRAQLGPGTTAKKPKRGEG